MDFLWTAIIGIVVVVVLIVLHYYCYCLTSQNSETSLRTKCARVLPKSRDVVAIDCEMVRCSPSKSLPTVRSRAKEVSVAVHCAIVGYNNEVLYEEFICPPLDSDVANWMGYEDDSYRERIKKSVPFSEAREDILNKLSGKIVVVHDFHKDFYSLKIKDQIPEKNIRDTSTCDMLCKKLLKKSPDKSANDRMKLKDLAKHILHKTIQKKTPHDPVEDAMAAMELYRVVEDEWEASLRE